MAGHLKATGPIIGSDPLGVEFADSYLFLPIYAKMAETNHQRVNIRMIERSDEILTIEEVAAYLKAGRRTVYRLAAKGQIPAFKLGGTWRFHRAELDRWIAARIGTQEGKPKPGGKP